MLKELLNRIKHNFTVWKRKRRKVTVEITGHAVARYRKRFLNPAFGNILTKNLKPLMQTYVKEMYVNNALTELDLENRYEYRDEVWILIVKDLKTHIKIKVVTCWKKDE